MSNIVKVYVISYPSTARRIAYINKSCINLIYVIKDSYISFKYHIHISVRDYKEPLDIVKNSQGDYWKSEEEAVEFIEKTFGNIIIPESFESL